MNDLETWFTTNPELNHRIELLVERHLRGYQKCSTVTKCVDILQKLLPRVTPWGNPIKRKELRAYLERKIEDTLLND